MLGLSLLVQTAASLGNTSIGPLAPALGRDLTLSGAQLGLSDPTPRPALATREV